MEGERKGMDPQAGTIQVGAVMEGKVTSITKFGAFVELENRRSGLVHISEIANTFVNDVRDFLQEGQTVKVLVLSDENGKINLSIKKAQPRPEGAGADRPRPASGYNRPRPAAGNDRPRPASGADRPRPASGRTYARAQGETLPPSGDQAFEDKLKRFLSSSEGKMADLNRSVDGKRGGGRRRR